MPRSFTVDDLAEASAHRLMAGIARVTWLTGRPLERWLTEQNIAKPDGEGNWTLTEHGQELAATVSRLRDYD